MITKCNFENLTYFQGIQYISRTHYKPSCTFMYLAEKNTFLKQHTLFFKKPIHVLWGFCPLSVLDAYGKFTGFNSSHKSLTSL